MNSFANSPAVQAYIAALKPTKDDDAAIVADLIDAVVAEIEENWRSAECVGEERDIFYAELHNPETNARELLGDQCEESPELTDEQWREVLDRLRVLFPNEEEWSEQCHACDTLLGGKVFHSEKEFDEHPDRDAGYNADGIWYCAEHREEAQKETATEECPECGEMEDSVYDYPEGRMCCDCRHGFKDRECEECGFTFNPKEHDTIRLCGTCWDKENKKEEYECACQECGGVIEGMTEEEYNGDDELKLCDACKEAYENTANCRCESCGDCTDPKSKCLHEKPCRCEEGEHGGEHQTCDGCGNTRDGTEGHWECVGEDERVLCPDCYEGVGVCEGCGKELTMQELDAISPDVEVIEDHPHCEACLRKRCV